MIAALPPQSRLPRTLARAPQVPARRRLAERESMGRAYWSVASRRRILSNIACCFREQAMMYLLQCEASTTQLIELRKYVQQTEKLLSTLEPATTQRLRPYGCICKLTDFDMQLAEVITTIAMFAPICQSVCFQRISLHIHLQVLFRRLLGTYEDTMSQLNALMSLEREEAVS